MPGTMKSVNKKANPGLAKLPTDVRNKMGYMQKGGKATKKYAAGGMGSEDEQFFGTEELEEAAKRPTYAQSTKLDERDKREAAIQERVREKAETFGEAFKAARKAGKKEFTYKGKSYAAVTKEEADTKKKAPAKKETATKKEPPSMKAGPSSLRSGAKAVAEKNPGDFDKMMEERKKAKKRTSTSSMTMDDIIGAKKGGMMKKYNVGGMVKANCGASMKPNGGSRNK